ncbi:uncharacterized protein [Pleurodeles waltl]|uniref:uncharacterized protein isoform X2 n=1 Tax=Pleurodeles waltl TaxID=8319 RepID=UPI00370981E4
MTHERRKGLLLKLDPKLANLAPKDPGAKADGLLFGDNFIKELRPVEAEAAPPTALPETKASEDHLLTSNNSNKTFVPSSIPSTPEDTEGGANADPTTIQPIPTLQHPPQLKSADAFPSRGSCSPRLSLTSDLYTPNLDRIQYFFALILAICLICCIVPLFKSVS